LAAIGTTWGWGAAGDLHRGVGFGIGFSDQIDGFEKNFVQGQFRLETSVLSAEVEWVGGIQAGLQGGWVRSWNLLNEELSNAQSMKSSMQLGATLGWRGPLGSSGIDLLILASGRYRGNSVQPWELGVEAGLMEKGMGYRFKAWVVPPGTGELVSRVGLSAQLVFEWGTKVQTSRGG
jgi:hypothetical protein